MSTVEDELMRRIKILSERLWEGHCKTPDVEEWLSNFDGRHCGQQPTERLHALHLLSSVSYFGLRELRVLLKSLYRDLFRYPIVQGIRDSLAGTKDLDAIEAEFQQELKATRFLGMGNPAESGTHLLYYFRQENRLPRKAFVNQHEILTSGATDPAADIAPPELRRLVFIDDLCGSGEQSIRYSRTLLKDLRSVASRRNRTLEFQYLVLFGTEQGLNRARTHSGFDVVRSVFELDETYKTFEPKSRVFRKPPAGLDRAVSRQLAHEYGQELVPHWPLGYGNGQLLLAFHHNVPDNSLPIIWFDEGAPSWRPAIPRQPKID